MMQGHSTAAAAWRAGVVQRLRCELDSLTPDKRLRIEVLVRTLQAMGQFELLRLYRAAVIGEAASTIKFPPFDQAPFNLTDDELSREWEEGRV